MGTIAFIHARFENWEISLEYLPVLAGAYLVRSNV